MPMNIDPTLKAKVASAVKIAQATFAKDCSEEDLIAMCLRTYIDRGLAKIEFDSNGSSTVLETELLKNAAPVLLDLSNLQFDPSKEVKPPTVVGSLKIILETFFKCIEAQNPSEAKKLTEELVLTAWAAAEYAVCIGDVDSSTWHVTPQMLGTKSWLSFREYPAFSRWLRDCIQNPRMDQTLNDTARFMQKLATRETGWHVSKLVGNAATLLTFELSGEAIAYRDDYGCLAWKASSQFAGEMA